MTVHWKKKKCTMHRVNRLSSRVVCRGRTQKTQTQVCVQHHTNGKKYKVEKNVVIYPMIRGGVHVKGIRAREVLLLPQILKYRHQLAHKLLRYTTNENL